VNPPINPGPTAPGPNSGHRTPHAHLVQPDIAWENPQENYERVRQLLDRVDLSPGDLVLLPEMFDTGFSFNIEKTNDKGGATLAFFVELASEFHVLVQGGRTVAACHRCDVSNVMTVVGSPGSTGRASPAGPGAPTVLCEYTKIHPFSIGKEHEALVGRILISDEDRNWDSVRDLWKLKERVNASNTLKAAFQANETAAGVMRELATSARFAEIFFSERDRGTATLARPHTRRRKGWLRDEGSGVRPRPASPRGWHFVDRDEAALAALPADPQ